MWLSKCEIGVDTPLERNQGCIQGIHMTHYRNDQNRMSELSAE